MREGEREEGRGERLTDLNSFVNWNNKVLLLVMRVILIISTLPLITMINSG